MSNSYPSYSVAIRTLGKAGEKYIREIESVFSQSLKPDGVYVYIPHGYFVQPVKEEVYIKCEKGMVKQRSLPFSEISSDYILFLDDDMYLPINAVKDLFDALIQYQADCIAVNAFDTSSWKTKIINGFLGGTYPTFHREYAYKVRDDSHFSYCIKPSPIMKTQSAPFACFLCNKIAYHEIHFENECWLDNFQYALGDDQLFFYKLFKIGKKILIHFDSGIEHLDARTGSIPNKKLRDYNSRLIRFIIWHRSIYMCKKNAFGKIWAVFSFTLDFIRSLFECSIRLFMGNIYAFPNSIRAIINGIKFILSKDYKSLPRYL